MREEWRAGEESEDEEFNLKISREKKSGAQPVFPPIIIPGCCWRARGRAEGSFGDRGRSGRSDAEQSRNPSAYSSTPVNQVLLFYYHTLAESEIEVCETELPSFVAFGVVLVGLQPVELPAGSAVREVSESCVSK